MSPAQNDRGELVSGEMGQMTYTLNGHNVRSCVHRGDAEGAEKTQNC